MSRHSANVLWLRDILEHLSANQQQLEWAEDNETVRLVTEKMMRDLERCQRLCEAINQRAQVRSAV